MEIYDLIDPRVITATLRQLPEDPRYRLNVALPDIETQSIEYAIDEITAANEAATFRAFDAPVEIGQEPGLVRRTGELPALGRGYLIGEYRRLLQEQLRGSNISEEMTRLVLDRGARGVAAIRARMEVARGQLLSTGKFTLAGEGGLYGLEADFGVPGGHKVTAGTAWSDPTANIIAQIQAWTDLAEADSGHRPEYMVAGRTAMAEALGNTVLRNYYGNAFGAAPQLSVAQVNEVLSAHDLPIFLVDPDTGRAVRPAKVNVAGVSTDTFPTDKVALFPADVGSTLWGPTFEALELAAEGRIEAQETPGIVGIAMREGNPGKIFSTVNATALPVLAKPDALIIATT